MPFDLNRGIDDLSERLARPDGIFNGIVQHPIKLAVCVASIVCILVILLFYQSDNIARGATTTFFFTAALMSIAILARESQHGSDISGEIFRPYDGTDLE